MDFTPLFSVEPPAMPKSVAVVPRPTFWIFRVPVPPLASTISSWLPELVPSSFWAILASTCTPAAALMALTTSFRVSHAERSTMLLAPVASVTRMEPR